MACACGWVIRPSQIGQKYIVETKIKQCIDSISGNMQSAVYMNSLCNGVASRSLGQGGYMDNKTQNIQTLDMTVSHREW